MSRPPKLTPAEAKQRLLLILEEGTITYTSHCRDKRMRERNVTAQDVEYLFEHGVVSENVEWCEKHQNWKYAIKGTDIEGECLGAITVIIEAYLMARVITVFGD